VTEQELRDALAAYPTITMTACVFVHGGAYVNVKHRNGGKWVVAVGTGAMAYGAGVVAADIATRVAASMMNDSVELLKPRTNVVARGEGV